MSKPYLSVILPSIRPPFLERVYASIRQACPHFRFEMIVISPCSLPTGLDKISNVKFIRDFGQPSRCANMGLALAEGQMVSLLSDDCIVRPQSYDAIDAQYCSMGDEGFIGLKYNEGKSMDDLNYWRAKSHPPLQLDGLRDDMPVSSMIYAKTENLRKVGGWDSINFECINWGGHDLTARLMNAGLSHQLSHDSFCEVEWGPGIDGLYNDHRPLWESYEDGRNMMKKLWGAGPAVKTDNQRIIVDISNWTKAPSVWQRRFIKGNNQ